MPGHKEVPEFAYYPTDYETNIFVFVEDSPAAASAGDTTGGNGGGSDECDTIDEATKQKTSIRDYNICMLTACPAVSNQLNRSPDS